MPKKIKLTENQLKNIIEVINEQKYDDAVVKYQKEANKQVSMSQNDAELLLNLGMNWCEGKTNHPDCTEILRVKSQLNLY